MNKIIIIFLFPLLLICYKSFCKDKYLLKNIDTASIGEYNILYFEKNDTVYKVFTEKNIKCNSRYYNLKLNHAYVLNLIRQSELKYRYISFNILIGLFSKKEILAPGEGYYTACQLCGLKIKK